MVTRAARSTTAGSRTCTLVVLNESCTGWPHAASSPPCSLACDACVAPEASPRARCQCSPWTTTYLHETPTPEALEPNPVAPVSSPRKTTSAVSPTAVSAPREGAPRKDVPRTIARESADARAPNVSGARRAGSDADADAGADSSGAESEDEYPDRPRELRGRELMTCACCRWRGKPRYGSSANGFRDGWCQPVDNFSRAVRRGDYGKYMTEPFCLEEHASQQTRNPRWPQTACGNGARTKDW